MDFVKNVQIKWMSIFAKGINEEMIENCGECGSPLLTRHNDSDREFWIECEDCGNVEEITKEEYSH